MRTDGATNICRMVVIDGVHRGSDIRLKSGTYVLGSPSGNHAVAETSLILLHDWVGAACTLHVGAGGVTVCDDGRRVSWQEGSVCRFGGISFRLEGRRELSQAAKQNRNGTAIDVHKRRPVAAVLSAILFALAFLSALVSMPAGVAAGPGHRSLSSRDGRAVSLIELKSLFHAQGLLELDVVNEGRGIRVVGYVADAREDAVARDVIRRLPDARPDMAWSVASTVASTIAMALRSPEVVVRYLGEGRFVAEGRSPAPERIEAMAVKLRNDLGLNPETLQINLISTRATRQYSVMLDADGVRYDKRADGTKRFLEAAR